MVHTLENIYEFGTEKTYFSCLDIHEPCVPYSFDKIIEDTVESKYALKTNSILLSRYKVIRLLQKNTFGFVYLVEKVNKDTQFIIKEFFPHDYVTRNDKDEMILNTPLDIDSLTRFNYMQNFFKGEANSLEKISIKPHININKAASIEKNKNNTSYIIYPYKEGMTYQRFMEIKTRIGKGKLEKYELDNILNPLLDAVEHLHSLGIYHLNIKPENILVLKNGSFLLTGLESSTYFTDEDSKVFCNAYTEQYAAPEQLNNDVFNIGKASDIYAIGALLHKLIVGDFPPTAQERMSSSYRDNPDDPYIPLEEKKELLEKYDVSFLRMVDKCMSLSLKDRHKDIESLRKSMYVGSAIKTESIWKNKISYLFYFLLLLLLTYIVFEVFKGPDNKGPIARDTQKNILKNDKNNSIDAMRADNMEDNQKNLDENTKKTYIEKYSTFSEETQIEELALEDNNETLSNENTEIIDTEESSTFSMETQTEEVSLEEVPVEKVPVEDENEKKEIIHIENKSTILNNNKIEELAEEDEDNLTNNIKDEVENEVNSMLIAEPIVEINETKMDENNSKHKENINKNSTSLINNKKQKKGVFVNKIKKDDNPTVIKVKENIIQQRRKSVNDRLKTRKKHINIKKKLQKRIRIQHKKPQVKRSSGLVWYCKAIGGNIRSSARNPNKQLAKQRALRQCQRQAGSIQSCRILNCFLVR